MSRNKWVLTKPSLCQKSFLQFKLYKNCTRMFVEISCSLQQHFLPSRKSVWPKTAPVWFKEVPTHNPETLKRCYHTSASSKSLLLHVKANCELCKARGCDVVTWMSHLQFYKINIVLLWEINDWHFKKSQCFISYFCHCNHSHNALQLI